VEYFRVVNFEKYQHYKKRSPPWIKLHRRVFSNYEISQLPDNCKAHIFCIWLLASEHNNVLPWDEEWISGQINADTKVDLELLEANKLIEKIKKRRKQSASKKKAGCKQNAPASVSVSYSVSDRIFIGLKEEDIEQWKKTYPLVSIEAEIKKAESWYEANPEKRWTNIKRGLVNWFARSQKQAEDKPKPKRDTRGGENYEDYK
jgi:hypothetical protein